ncbi:hypothetical protein JRO89_XS06G0149600 [Xanthoceras sorbifolium]|uniref:Uncharacterized protein n=1 Tax=Xanthoceras sorbifolium TaxID=99658 RepID=A0ABQ8HYG1_9ROSI|nr:hypothetical protein JRO89_XS06G0149600 [Xanthoceras sorbifolium]
MTWIYQVSLKDRQVYINRTRNLSLYKAFLILSYERAMTPFLSQEDKKATTRLGSKLPVNETIKTIEAAAMDVSLSIQKMNNFKMKMHPKQRRKMIRCCRSYYDLSAEVIEVAPTNCVIEISKSVGELRLYNEFCKSLSSLLSEKSYQSPQMQESKEVKINSKSTHEIECSGKKHKKDYKDIRGYSSS